ARASRGRMLTRVSVRSEGPVADCTNACFMLQGRACHRWVRAPENRRHARGTRGALIGVGILVIWILLGGAYAWSVWNLARMVRSQDSGASPVASLPSSQAQQIELVHPGKTPRRSALAAQLLQPPPVATRPRRPPR